MNDRLAGLRAGVELAVEAIALVKDGSFAIVPAVFQGGAAAAEPGGLVLDAGHASQG